MKSKIKKVVRECSQCNFQIELDRNDPYLISSGKIREGVKKHDASRNHYFSRLDKNFMKKDGNI